MLGLDPSVKLTPEQRKFIKARGLLAAHYMIPMHYYYPVRGVKVPTKSETVQEMIALGLITCVAGDRYRLTPEGVTALDTHFNR